MKHLQEQDQQLPQWLSLVRQRIETAARVHTGLGSMSAAWYPHGEPFLISMEALIANDPFGFVEDQLLEIVFHGNRYFIMFYVSDRPITLPILLLLLS